MNKQTVLVLGANSDIAFAVAGKYAQNKSVLILAGRNPEKLKEAAADLQIRFSVDVFTVPFDAHDYAGHKRFYEQLPLRPDVVVLAFGILGDTDRALADWDHAEEILSANYTGAVSVLNVVADDFQQRGKGTIVGISSVAGERGRQSNFIYGSAKAGLTAYLSGLRNRLVKYGVHVVTVKPGFVRTKMIEGIQTSALLTASPDEVAAKIMKAVRTKKNVVYVKPIWRVIMLIIRSIPEFIFKKLSL
jgi:short-subunit dehydrogenase